LVAQQTAISSQTGVVALLSAWRFRARDFKVFAGFEIT